MSLEQLLLARRTSVHLWMLVCHTWWQTTSPSWFRPECGPGTTTPGTPRACWVKIKYKKNLKWIAMTSGSCWLRFGSFSDESELLEQMPLVMRTAIAVDINLATFQKIDLFKVGLIWGRKQTVMSCASSAGWCCCVFFLAGLWQSDACGHVIEAEVHCVFAWRLCVQEGELYCLLFIDTKHIESSLSCFSAGWHWKGNVRY